MNDARSRRGPATTAVIIIALTLVLGIVGTTFSSFHHVSLDDVDPAAGSLSVDETAYYEYVAPRMDALIEEVDIVTPMVEGKSRDILALSRGGAQIETLTSEIRQWGEDHGVPDRFANVHRMILTGSDTITGAFDQAREVLRTFRFSEMRELVPDFRNAADQLRVARDELKTAAS